MEPLGSFPYNGNYDVYGHREITCLEGLFTDPYIVIGIFYQKNPDGSIFIHEPFPLYSNVSFKKKFEIDSGIFCERCYYCQDSGKTSITPHYKKHIADQSFQIDLYCESRVDVIDENIVIRGKNIEFKKLEVITVLVEQHHIKYNLRSEKTKDIFDGFIKNPVYPVYHLLGWYHWNNETMNKKEF